MKKKLLVLCIAVLMSISAAVVYAQSQPRTYKFKVTCTHGACKHKAITVEHGGEYAYAHSLAISDFVHYGKNCTGTVKATITD